MKTKSPRSAVSFPRVALASIGLLLQAACTQASVTADLPATAGTPGRTENDESVARAKAVLMKVMTQERSWKQVHAAEALIAVGESVAVRTVFANEPEAADLADYRIGIWRVRAAIALSRPERKQWLNKIEAAFCDPRSPDRLDAIESLSKLGFAVSGETLAKVRQLAATAPEGDKLFALWALAKAEEPGAIERIIAALDSTDIFARQRAAYALRWLHVESMPVKQGLVRAVQAEPVDTYPYVYLLSAALVLDADPSQRGLWRGKLEKVLATGPASARFEAIQCLMTGYGRADVPRLAPMLQDGETDTRISAAWGILSIQNREQGLKTEARRAP
ncbi:MAG: hypothetical protein PSU94_01790 [Lacunisphaera sp.]|nr:hypothetical protein [Lacunisphaera sp.]